MRLLWLLQAHPSTPLRVRIKSNKDIIINERWLSGVETSIAEALVSFLRHASSSFSFNIFRQI